MKYVEKGSSRRVRTAQDFLEEAATFDIKLTTVQRMESER